VAQSVWSVRETVVTNRRVEAADKTLQLDPLHVLLKTL
jgi:hypothetical protein